MLSFCRHSEPHYAHTEVKTFTVVYIRVLSARQASLNLFAADQYLLYQISALRFTTSLLDTQYVRFRKLRVYVIRILTMLYF